jgi:glucans biosynthesis protein
MDSVLPHRTGLGMQGPRINDNLRRNWKWQIIWCLIPALFFLHEPSSEAKSRFTIQEVVDKAKQLAEKPFQVPVKVPEFLLKISYDDWRDIRFDQENALWKKDRLPFAVQFFHPGLYYDRTVTINVVDSGGIHNVPFSKDMFHYGRNTFKDRIPPDLGFAGFRLHYPINTPEYFDEVAVFLGASHFRAVAKNQNYGIVARGLAVDTALSTGEEIPYFRRVQLRYPPGCGDHHGREEFSLLPEKGGETGDRGHGKHVLLRRSGEPKTGG